MENLQVIIKQNAGSISLNFDEMKEFLTNRLEEFRGATFTDDSIKAAKKVIAELRKEQAAFKSRITEVKKSYMKPFDDFKIKADELVRLYDEPIRFIDGQVEDFEKRRKAEKQKEIIEIYGKYASDVSEYIPIEKIYNPKWENTTYKKKDIIKDISNAADSVRQAVETINGMDSEVCDKALAMYKKDLSLTNAITYINNYEHQKAEILKREQERKRIEEEERIRREEREKLLAEQKASEEKEEFLRKVEEEKQQAVESAKEETAREVIDSFIPDMAGETNLYEYRIALNSDAKEKLEMYLDSIGVDWELI